MNDTYCPEHGSPDLPSGEGWSHCPTAVEGDPDDVQTCHWFAHEIDRRIMEITEQGNYYSLLPGEPRRVQEYRNHQKHGPPKPL